MHPAFALIFLPILALLFNWPYLNGGFYADDFLLINIFEQDPLPFSRWLGIWSVDSGPGFDNLWWKDTGWGANFWRPIPSLIFEGSLSLFGRNAFPLHLLSILLHGTTAAGLYLFVKKLTNKHILAFLAGLFFIACEDHSFVIGWISTITDPMCVLFILLAFLGHIKWLQKRSVPALIGSISALPIALACKETAVVAPLAMILITFLMPDGKMTDGFSFSGFLRQVKKTFSDYPSWLPATLILIAYLALYFIFELAKMNNLGYINPINEPVRFLSHMIVHLPIFWLGALSFFPPFLTMFLPNLAAPAAIAGVILFMLWVIALWSFRKNTLVLWTFIIFLVALLPQVAADASERGLYFPMIPGSILLAILAVNIKPIAKRVYQKIKVNSRYVRFVGWFVLLTILIPGIIISATRPIVMKSAFAQPEKEMLTAMPYIKQDEPDDIIILNTSGFSLTLYTHDIINYHSEIPQNVFLLSAAYGKFSLQRTGDSTFVIRTNQPGWLSNFFALMMRNKPLLKAGNSYYMTDFKATILETTGDEREVLAVKFDFGQNLENSGNLFLCWNGKSFKPVDFTKIKIGDTIDLADTSDLMKALM